MSGRLLGRDRLQAARWYRLERELRADPDLRAVFTAAVWPQPADRRADRRGWWRWEAALLILAVCIAGWAAGPGGPGRVRSCGATQYTASATWRCGPVGTDIRR